MLASIMMTITLINTMTVVLIAVSYRSGAHRRMRPRREFATVGGAGNPAGPARRGSSSITCTKDLKPRHYTFRLSISPQHG
jgi:hypothetical protein